MVDVVVKVGGGLLPTIETLDRVLAAISKLARSRRVLIVPGGGPFADTVRGVDRRIGIPGEAAHWMAVLAMDQYAHLLAARLDAGTVVSSLRDADGALDRLHVPVLAPSRWLFDADPLPHTWDVTSDSIAAWVAGEAGARDLVLVKPTGAAGALVDDYFLRALPQHVTPVIVPAEHAVITLDQIAGNVNPDVETT